MCPYMRSSFHVYNYYYCGVMHSTKDALCRPLIFSNRQGHYWSHYYLIHLHLYYCIIISSEVQIFISSELLKLITVDISRCITVIINQSLMTFPVFC